METTTSQRKPVIPKISKCKYFGITHGVPMNKLAAWRREKCVENIHAFDEVWSVEGHHLACDACGLSVEIAGIDTQYVKKGTIKGK
jgi:hypothetical protein